MEPYVTDTSVYLNKAIDDGLGVLFEGSQGTLLDIDHGTFPYVTSSNTTAGGACTGSGIGPTRIDEVVGVVKAYTTRVGNGPFPTEIEGELGDRIRNAGGPGEQEFGATTGRPRRCGWLDAVILRFSARISGLSSLAVTRMDILDELDELQICTHYELNGKRQENFPSDLSVLAKCRPVYESHPGWQTSTKDCRTLADLPENARTYVARIEELSNTPVSLISVGADREQTIVVPVN